MTGNFVEYWNALKDFYFLSDLLPVSFLNNWGQKSFTHSEQGTAGEGSDPVWD